MLTHIQMYIVKDSVLAVELEDFFFVHEILEMPNYAVLSSKACFYPLDLFCLLICLLSD